MQSTRPPARAQSDASIDIDLSSVLAESQAMATKVTPDSGPWDVIIVGSGAAGGMAAFQLAIAGIKVLVLEAGRMLDGQKEYRTMEWPYQSLRRQRMPADMRSLNVAEYNFVDRPYGNHPEFEKYKKLTSYAGNTFTRNWVVNEKENPTTGTPYAWVRARILGGKTNFWGRGALRYGPYEFKARSHDGYAADWPIGYDDVKGYPAPIAFGGFGEVLPRWENRVLLDPQVVDAWGIPVLRFDYRFGDNEKKMVADMADSIEEMFRAAGAEDIEIGREALPEGWSIHEIGTARMGNDPKTSYTDAWCRPHGIANVFLADASPYVSGGTQNTTWTILAMCWRTTDFVNEQMRAGNL